MRAPIRYHGHLAQNDEGRSALATVHAAVSLVGAPLAAYHGYKRNESVGWAIAWFLLGGVFPYITLPVAVAQGYGKRRS